MRSGEGVSSGVRVRPTGLRRLIASAVAFVIAATTFVAATATGASADVLNLNDFDQPLFARTSAEQLVSEADGSSTEFGFGPTGAAVDVAMFIDRRTVVASTTDLTVVRPDNTADPMFGVEGRVWGFGNIVSIAVDDTAGLIYVLDRGATDGAAILALDTQGVVTASVPAGDAVTLVSGGSWLIALDATGSASTVFAAGLTNPRPLVQAPGSTPFGQISDAAWFARGGVPGLAIADRTGGVVRRVALGGLDGGDSVSIAPHPRAVPTADVLFEAPSSVTTDAAGNLFVSTGETAPYRVLRLAADGQSTRFIVHDGLQEAPLLAVAPTSTAPPAPARGTSSGTSTGTVRGPTLGPTGPSSGGIPSASTPSSGGTVGVSNITTGETAKFKIESLTVSQTNRVGIDMNGLISDDRGGMALSATKVFLRGDGGFGYANKSDLSGSGAVAGAVQHDAPVSDLRAMKAYVFDYTGSGSFTRLTEIDQSTGAIPASPTVITLSSSIPYSGGEIYSGYGRVVYRNANGTVYDIDLPSGDVIIRGTLTNLTRQNTENWTAWGVAEFFDGQLWLAVNNTAGDAIVRYRVSDGATQTVASAGVPWGFGDMASFIVDPTNQRWYFHYEGSASAFNLNLAESLVYAPAVISTTPSVTITPSATPTNADTLAFNVTFSEAVTGVAATDFVLGGTSAGWSITGLVANSPTSYTLNVAQTGNADGTLNATLLANSVNWTAGSTTIPDSNTVSTNAVIDNTAPSVTSVTGVSGTQNLNEFTYTLNMAEAVTGFAPTDVSVTGVTGCSISTGTSSSSVYLVTLTGCSSGSAVLSLATNSVTDLAGNTGPSTQFDAAAVTIAAPSISVPSSVPVDTGAFVTIASRASAISINNVTAATVNVVVTPSAGFVKLGTTTGLSAIPGYTTAQWTANNSTAIGFNASPANANAALATLQYQGATSGSTPTIGVRVTPGSTTVMYSPATGRYYERVSATLTHDQALAAASTRSFAGRTGHLATVTSSAENDFLVNIVSSGNAASGGWLAGSDSAAEGTWRWGAGPESGTQFWSGAAAGSTVGGSYANWGTSEPNGGTGENCLTYWTSNKWNDAACGGTTSTYFVEYGGRSADVPAAVNVSASASLIVAPAAPAVSGAPSGTTSSTSATLTLTGSGTVGATFECSLDGAPWSSCTSPVSLTGLAPGSHTFRARETVSGVTGNNSSNTWTVDPVLGPPVATWGATSATPTNSASQTFGLSFNEQITGLTGDDVVNAGSSSGCSFQITGAQPGTTFTVTATGCSEGTVRARLTTNSVADLSGTAGPESPSNANGVAATITGIGSSMMSGITPNGAFLYVPDNGSAVRVVNTTTNAVTATISVGSTPRSASVSPDGTRAYITNYSSNTVSVINTSTNTVTATISGFSNPNRAAVSPDGTRLYVANVGNNTVSVVNTSTNAIITSVSLSATPWSLAINPAGTRVYTGNYVHSSVSVINTSTNTLVTSVSVGANPHEIAVSNSGDRVFVANNSSNSVSVINTTTNTVSSTITGFTSPMAIGVSIDDSTLYVGQFGHGSVRMYNLVTNTLGSTIATGSHPRTITPMNDGTKFYVNNFDNATITVVNGTGAAPSATVTIDRTAPTASFTSTPGAAISSTGTYTLTANETITGVEAGDFDNAGTATGCVFTPATSSGTAIAVTVTGCSAGTLTARLLTGTISDSAGNAGPPSNVIAGTSTAFDPVLGPPVASWTSASASPTNGTSQTFGLSFNEQITGLTGDDVVNAGSSSGCSFQITGAQPGTTFTVTATGCSEGTVRVRLTAQSVSDLSGTAGPGGGGAANTVASTISSVGNVMHSGLTPNGAFLYAPDFGSSVRVINTATNAVTATITVGSGSRSVAVSPDGTRAYVANYYASTVSVINTATNTVTATISGFSNPNRAVVSPDGTRLYVANLGGTTVSVVNTSTNAIIATVSLSATPWSIAINPAGTRVYTGNYVHNSVSVVNTATNTLVTNVTVGTNPYEIAVSNSGDRVFAANYGSGSVSAINTTTNTVSSTITGFTSPMAIGLSADDATLYVGQYGYATLRMVNLSNNSLGSTITVGTYPWTITPANNGTRFYVNNYDSATITVVNGAGAPPSSTVTIDRTAPTASFTANPGSSISTTGNYTLTANETITGLAAADFINAGTATDCIFTPASATGTAITVTVTGCTAGTLIARLRANSITDSAGNNGPASAVTAGSTTTVDPVPGAPIPSWGTTSASPTNGAAQTFALTFNEQITGLTGDDITNAGTAANCVFAVTGTQPGTTFTVTATGCGEGAVRARLTALSVTDMSGTAGPASAGTAHTVAATITGIGSSMMSAVTPNGAFLYVPDNGSAVRVVNTTTNAVTATISVGSTPRSAAVSPDGTRAYITNYSSNTVSVINAATNTVTATISGFSNPNRTAISPDGTRLYVANVGNNTVSVVNTSTNAIITSVSLSATPWSLVINPSGTRVYTANYVHNSVSVINTATNTLVTSVAVGANPYEIAVSSNGDRVFAANYSSNSVSVINTTTNTVSSTITGFLQPMAIGLSADDATLYVGQFGYGTVRMHNLVTNTLGSTIATGSHPRSITTMNDGTKFYVNNFDNATITVVNGTGGAPSAPVTIDRSAPTATWGTPAAGTTTFPLTFNENVTGIAAADFTNSGTSTGCIFAPSANTASAGVAINVVVTGCSTGTLIPRLSANTVTDAPGNTGPAADTAAGSVGVDGVPGGPVATWTVPTSPWTNASTISATLTFNEPVIGLTTSDFSVSGTATGCSVGLTGSTPGTTFTVTASSCSEGTVVLTLAASSVTDEALNAGPGTAAAANTVVRTVTGLSTPYYSALSRDGSTVWVANTNANTVMAYNTSTGAALASIAVGSSPRGIALSPNGDRLAVANLSSNSVTIIRTSDRTVLGTIGSVGTSPMGVAWSPTGRVVWVSNVGSNTVAALDTATMNVETSGIATGAYPNSIAVSPDGTRVWTSNVNSNNVTVINATTFAVVSTIGVGVNPYHLDINNSGTRVAVANFASNSVSIINASTNAVVSTVGGFSGPMGIVFSPDGSRAWVANRNNFTVRAVDMAGASPSLPATPNIPLSSQSPWGLTSSADGRRLAASFDSASRVMLIDTGLAQSAPWFVDRTAPTVTSIVSDSTSPNDFNEQSWTVTFSEEVTDVTASDFALSGTSTGWSNVTVSGTGRTRTVTATNNTPNAGTIILTLTPDSVQDQSGSTGPTAGTAAAAITYAASEGVFRVDGLATTGFSGLEVGSQTGDDRGGMALTRNNVLLTGDSSLARFGLTTLGNNAVVAPTDGTWMDGLATDLKTLRAYAFNVPSSRSGTLTTLTALDPATGLRTSNVITLSSPITLGGTSAIFAGFGRIVVYTNGRVWDVAVPSGNVTNLGTMALPGRSGSESWATWGVAEYFGGRLYLTYVKGATSIERARVPDAQTTTVATFTGLSDMASFVVNPRTNRWYFHYEGNASSFSFGSDETIGYANATVNLGGTTPNPVTNLVASTRSTTALLTWTAPAAGPTPTDYLVEYTLDNGTTWTWVNDGVSTTTNASVPSLTPGNSVRFRVTTVANLNASAGVVTDASVVSPFASAPTISSVTTGNTQLSVAFTPPTVAGASTITNYQFSTDAGATWTTRNPASTNSPLVIPGLVNGTSYGVSIRAVNSNGPGDASVVFNATPSTTAGAPTISTVTPSASQTLSVAFTAPTADGGNTISNYQYSLNGGTTWITRSPAAVTSPLVITGLANGSSYSVVLRAVNVNGGGSGSNAVAAIPGVPPGAPTISSVSTSDSTLSVVFAAPASNGSIAITNYEWSLDGTTWTTRSPASTASPMVISSLANGTVYTVRIRAVNPAGAGTASSSASGTPSRTPDAPTITGIEPSSGRLRVSYSAPTFNGGAVITNYEYSINDGSTWVTLNPASTSGTFSITSLVNARTYPVRVRAVNLRGSGTASAAVDGTPATTPGAPTISGITPSNGRLDVAFVAGADGGAAATNYEWSTDDGTTWTTRSPASTASPIAITGLANGTTYAVRIRSVNSQGAGGASAASDGTPATVPGAPTIGAVTGSNTRLSVALTPGATGGATITNYEWSLDNGATWTARTPASAVSPMVIAGLVNGTDYSVRVRAVNSQGSGAASAPASGRPATVPGSPTIDGVAGDPGQLTVSFTAPATDGGNTISNYEWSTNGGATWTARTPAATTSPITLTGLVDGTVYSVRIRAVNAQGAGTSSNAVDGTPVNTPGAPAINNIISGSGFLRVDFAAAPGRGATVTNYEYSLDNGTSWTTLNPAATTSPLTINNLSNGTTYQVVMRGVNARGSGVASAMVTGTPSAPPSAPTITTVTAGGVSGSLSVAFTAGSSGGAAITGTEYSIDGGTSWASAGSATSPVLVTGLTNGSTYSVKLRSVNVRGAGTASGAVSGTPIWTPGAPSLSSSVGSDQTITLYFSPPTDTGGSAVTNYEYTTDGGTTWTARNPVSTARPLVITGLVNGTAYNTAVRAVNARGAGTSSNTIGAKPATVPGAPSITSVTASHTSLSVAFTAPVSDGGEAVSNYEYSIDNGQTWTARNPATPGSPLLITALNNATDYTVKLRAVNVRGAGPASTGAVGRPAGAPDAPVVAGIASTDGGLSVSFVAGSDNGAAITNVEWSTDNGVTWTTRSPASATSPLSIGDLQNGTGYQVRIRTVNAQGSGAASTATSATPATVPSAPTIDSITPADGSLSVTLTDGATGGAAISSYGWSTDNGTTWTATGSTSRTFTIPSLVNGTSYPVKVRAINRIGAGTASDAVSATPSRAPYAPTITSVLPGNGRVTVTFTEGNNGGAATTTLRYSTDGGTTWTSRATASTSSPLLIETLTNGTVYPIKLQMVNARGNGDPSAPSNGTPSTVPGTASIASITSGNRSLTVAVTPPATDGGDPITHYEYTLNNGTTWTAEGTAVSTGSFTVPSLSNGTTYTVKIRAVNGRGPGTASTGSNGTPSTVPSMPAIISVTPGNELVDVAFALGSNGGAQVSNLQYSIDDGVIWTTRNPASVSSPLRITGLSNGVTYPIRVRAVNVNGTGVSSRSSGTPATTPDKPTITRVVPGDGELTVEFESPEDNGGAEITNYAYAIDGGSWVVLSPASVDSPFTITGLPNGTNASITLAAINTQGRGTSSDAVIGNPATLPGAAVISGPTVGDGTLNVGWYVLDDGGRAITSVDYSLDNGDTWTNVAGDATPLVVTGLSNGTTYDVRIRARNAVGIGAASTMRQLTPASPPAAPAIGAITRTNGRLTVNFSLGFDGGAAATNVEYSTDGGGTWTTRDPASTASPLDITGLSNGTTYQVKLRAVNAQGAGTASTSVTGTPATVAAAPSISSITRGDASASVAFTLGADNGAAATNIEYSVDDGLTWTTRNPASTTSPLPLPGLQNGTPHQVRLRAVNPMGTGAESTAVTVTPARAPDAPVITAATGENGRAVISFVPGNDGGNAITNYAWSIDDGVTWTTRSPISVIGPIVVTGLANGTTYPVRLKAINGVGESAQSPAVDALPSGPPLAPTITSITGSNTTLSVSFTAGATGGAPISAYQASTDGGSTWIDVTGTASPLTVTGLVNGVVYSVAIRAVNSRGPGTASSTESGVPATVPEAPQITQIISASGAVDVAFTLGGNGGASISNIEYSLDGGDNWTVRSPVSTAGPLRLTGLSNGTTYPIRIRAVNSRGPGAQSAIVDALPATTPGAPAVTGVTSGNGTLMVAFTAPSDTGGAPIQSYQYSLDGGDNWANAAATSSPIEINDVTVGTEYDVAIRAVNLRGPGTASNAATKRATAPPAAPTITSLQAGNGEIVVRFAPPSDTGGDVLQDFFYSTDGGVTWTNTSTVQSQSQQSQSQQSPRTPPLDRWRLAMLIANGVSSASASSGPVSSSSVTSLRLANLVNGQSYEVAVRASNTDVLGTPSVTVMGIPSTVPSAPRNLAVSAGDARLTIGWDAPSSDGGLTISRYEYSLDGGTVWNDVAENPMTLRGLDNGTTYQVKVRAFNDNGSSPATGTVTGKPTTVPRAPQAPTATAGFSSASLTWPAPVNDGGTAITDYVIEYSDNAGGTWQTVADGISAARAVLISNLTIGRSYIFRVTAVNAVGQGETSMASNAVIPVAAPAPAPAPTPAPTPVPEAEPVVTPVPAPVTKPVVQPVSAPKKDETAPRTPIATPLPDVSKPMDNADAAAVTDGAGAVFGMPESGWVEEAIEDQAYTVTTSEKIRLKIALKTGATNLTVGGKPAFEPGDGLAIAVSGLLPGSETSAWVFSTPVLLGRGATDATGSLTARYVIPGSLAAGEHTVQLNGIAPDGTVRSIEVKIVVVRESTDDTAPNDVVTTPVDDDGGSTPTGLILVAALLGLILAAGAALNLRRRAKRTD